MLSTMRTLVALTALLLLPTVQAAAQRAAAPAEIAASEYAARRDSLLALLWPELGEHERANRI